jgi:eukaryotic-like serine/threonine-protein kinase
MKVPGETARNRWRTIMELFDAAAELPAGQRRAFLESASCSADILKEVLELLGKLEASGDDSAAPARVIPERIGRYVILKRLGQGGTGAVFSARDTDLDRTVALKFITVEAFGGRSGLECLKREAKALAALNHPNIVTVYDVVRSGDEVAIAMELVEGEALRKYCGAPQAVAEVIRWARQVAQALAAAHSRNIAHRDIKPENLMVRSDGYLKVLDFGLARRLAVEGPGQPGNSTANSTGGVAGTLNYMAPEQTRAEAPTCASDVFSLGIVLYELGTGTHPFRSDSPVDTAHAIAHAEPKSPRALNHEIPPALNSLLLAMLAKNPEDRPSAADLDSRLTAIEAGDRAGSRASEKNRGAARSAGPRYLLAATGLVASLACVLALWLMRQRIVAPRVPTMTQLTTQESENRVTAAALSPDGKTLAFAALGDSIYLRRMSDGFTWSISTPPGLSVDRIAWFANDSQLLVSGSRGYDQGSLWFIPMSGDKPKLAISNGKDAVPSPDGRQIAFTNRDGSAIWVADVDGENARVIRDGGNATAFSSLIWSPDSKRVSYQRTDYGFQKRRPADQLSAQLQEAYSYSYESVDVQTGRVAASAENTVITSACGLPDGRVLFLRWISLPETLVDQLWELRTDPRTGKFLWPPRRLTYGTDSVLSSVSASNDGKQVVIVKTSYRPNLYVADLSPPGQIPRLLNVRRLTFDEAADFPHAWTPDDRTIIFESNRIGHFCLYRQNIGQAEAEPLVVSPGDNVMPQVSPDGRWALYESIAGTGNWTLMRIPIAGGHAERVPTDRKLNKFDEFLCPLDAGSECVLRTVENGQFVFNGLDPTRGEGRELARTDWSPAIIGDWALSPDGSEAAIPNHDPSDAKIRLIALKNRVPGMAEKTFTLSGLKDLNGVVWAADGRGLYVSVRTSLGGLVVYTNLQGHWSNLFESPVPTYIVPSPNGHQVAFPGFVARSNAYLLHGL